MKSPILVKPIKEDTKAKILRNTKNLGSNICIYEDYSKSMKQERRQLL